MTLTLYYLQTILAKIPNLNSDPIPQALFEVTNDEHLVMYTASIARSVIALHNKLME